MLNIKFYCIECRLYFHIDEASWDESDTWLQCPNCNGQEISIKKVK